MKRRALVTVMAIAVAVGVSAQTPVVTLSESIDAALANGFDNRILQATLDASRAQYAETVSKNSLGLAGTAAAGYNYPFGDAAVVSSKGSLLSSSSSATQGVLVGLGLNGPLTSVALSAIPWSPPVGSGDTTSLLGLSATQVLWNGYPGGTGQASVDKGLLSLQGAELATQSSRLGLVYRVKQAYFSMFAAQENLTVTQQILARQNALLDQLTTVHKLKQASDVDLKTAQINAQSAAIDVKTAEHTLRQARIQLSILMGRPLDAQYDVTEPGDPAVPASTLAEAIDMALSRRPEIRQLDLTRKSLAVDIALAQGQATPTISVTGGISQAFDWNLQTAWYANAGLKVTLPVLDAGVARNLVIAGQKQDQAYALQEQQLRATITAAIQSDWEALDLANQRVELARLTAENDDLLVEVYKIQAQNGTASEQDLLTASVTAAGAHTAYVQAQSNAKLAVLQLLSDMGY
ncbi:MAG TPA: TolC family protein [Spirochaetia bacterium]